MSLAIITRYQEAHDPAVLAGVLAWTVGTALVPGLILMLLLRGKIE